MDKINPLLYITDTDPVPEKVLNASGWFQTEYMDMDATSDAAKYLEWYMAQGWTLLPSTNSSQTTEPVWRWVGFYDPAAEHPSFANWGYADYTTPDGRYSGHWVSSTVTTTTYHLSRRKLQSERVLNDMIREFTEAYNEGREINDRRYDEIVAIYNVMLDKSQDELKNLDAVAASYNTVVAAIIASLETDFNAFKTDVGTLNAVYGDSRRGDIKIRFDNELAKARQSLVERGMNNSTVWASVSAGIERERERSLSDLEDKITDRRIGVAGTIHGARDGMRTKMLAAHDRLMATKREAALVPLDFRNKVLSAMLNFMERRTDEYPGLDGLANIASQLGYSEGAAVVAPTA
jgi:hypothetical protein